MVFWNVIQLNVDAFDGWSTLTSYPSLNFFLQVSNNLKGKAKLTDIIICILENNISKYFWYTHPFWVALYLCIYLFLLFLIV